MMEEEKLQQGIAVIAPVEAIAPFKDPKGHLFKPGHIFRPKGIGELRAAAKNMSMAMLQTVIDIALDEDQKGSVRLAAADMVLTRAYGKAESYHDKGEDSGKVSELSSNEILRLLGEVQNSVDGNDVETLEAPDTLTLEVSKQLEEIQELSSSEV